MIYCYVCVIHSKVGRPILYSYRNGLSQLVTGTVSGLSSLDTLLTNILNGSNTQMAYTDQDGNPMGVLEQVRVRGTSLCLYHTSIGVVTH